MDEELGDDSVILEFDMNQQLEDNYQAACGTFESRMKNKYGARYYGFKVDHLPSSRIGSDKIRYLFRVQLRGS